MEEGIYYSKSKGPVITKEMNNVHLVNSFAKACQQEIINNQPDEENTHNITQLKTELFNRLTEEN